MNGTIIKNFIIAVSFVFICFSCTTTAMMVQDDEKYISVNKNAKYGVLLEEENGFKLSILYSSYQFFPSAYSLIPPAKSTFVNISRDLCRQRKKRYGGFDETGYLFSDGRNELTGITYVRLDNWVKCSIPQKKAPDARSDVISKSKYESFFEAVVIIKTNKKLGTGFFVSNNGTIITNFHVIKGDNYPTVQLHNGQVLTGKVLDYDVERDLAVVKIEEKTSFLKLATLNDINIGDELIAIGAPMGLEFSITRGVVSAVRNVEDIIIIQTDAAMNPGNSGGPLILMKNGKVVGVNSFGYKKTITEGLNFAISSNEIEERFGSRVGARP